MRTEPASLDERLRRLIVFDIALAGGGGVVTMAASLTVARSGLLFGLGFFVLAIAGLIASALSPLASGNTNNAVLRLALANWIAALVTALVATFAWPLMMLTALFPSAFAGTFVSKDRVRPYLAVSFVAAVVIAALGLLQDLTGLSDDVPEWVRDLVLLLAAPPLAALVLWTTLQNSLRLQAALDDELAARQSLARQADELRLSRRRVVVATDRERRRIERDLHDGAQSRLIAVNLGLARLRSALTAEPDRALGIVEEIRADVQHAHGELRDLARGVYPTVLTQHGLTAAIAAAADHSGIQVRLALTEVGRHHGEIEAAIYFCILEALQNANRHSAATLLEVRLTIDNGELTFAVIDNGTGFDERSTAGVGLDNMTDRLGAVGGTIQVSSHRSRGTTVSGSVPLLI